MPTMSELESMRIPELQRLYAETLGEETRCPNKSYLIRRIMEGQTQEAPAEASQQALEAEATAPAPTTPEDDDEPELDEAELAAFEAELQSELETAAESTPHPSEAEAPQPVTVRVHVPTSQPPAPARPYQIGAPIEHGRFRGMTIDELRAEYLTIVGRPTTSFDKGYLVWKMRETLKGRLPVGPRESRTPEQQGTTEAKVLPLRLDARAVEAMDAFWKAQGIRSRMTFFRRAIQQYLLTHGAKGAAALFEAR